MCSSLLNRSSIYISEGGLSKTDHFSDNGIGSQMNNTFMLKRLALVYYYSFLSAHVSYHIDAHV
jgi:hypothetical protein